MRLGSKCFINISLVDGNNRMNTVPSSIPARQPPGPAEGRLASDQFEEKLELSHPILPLVPSPWVRTLLNNLFSPMPNATLPAWVTHPPFSSPSIHILVFFSGPSPDPPLPEAFPGLPNPYSQPLSIHSTYLDLPASLLIFLT